MLQGFRTAILLAALSSCSLLLGSRLVEAQTNAPIKTYWVAHYKVDCVGVGPQKCYLVKEDQYAEWQLFYSEIEGFQYQEGFAYIVRVAEEPVDDPPADGSSIRHRLVETVLRVEAFEDGWPANSAPGESDLPLPADEPADADPEPVPTPVEPEPTPVEPAPVEPEPLPVEEPEPTPIEQIEESDLPLPADADPEPEPTPIEQIEESDLPLPADEPADAESEPEPTPVEPEPQPIEEPEPEPVAPEPQQLESIEVEEPEPVAAVMPEPEPEPTPIEPEPQQAELARHDEPVTQTPPPALPSSARAPESTTSVGDVFRGHLTIGHGLETRAFEICGSGQGIWVEDESDDGLWETYRQLAGYPNRPLYMMVMGRIEAPPATGFGSHYESQLVVTELQYAATESPGCFDDLGSFEFRAMGNEPSWSLEISQRGLLLTELGGARELYSYNRPTGADGRTYYWGKKGGRTPSLISVTLQEAACTDTMSDTRYPYRASVKIGGRELTGCALAGFASP